MTAMMMGAVSYDLRGSTALSTPDPTGRRSLAHSLVKSSSSPEPFLMMNGGGMSSCEHSPVPQQGSPTSPMNACNGSPNHMTPSSPPNQRGVLKECGVCGDVAKSMHFGGLSCDSCKAFFRRSVQNNAFKGFSCPYEKNCNIGVSSRKACQYCRFHKCVSIGMEKSWVMTEEERRRMMQQRKEKKKAQEDEIPSHPKVFSATQDLESFILSEDDRNEIHAINTFYKNAYNQVPYDEETLNSQGSAAVLAPWMTFCKRLIYFFKLFKDFSELGSNDQVLLLKTALSSAGIIMGSVVYDNSSGKFNSGFSKMGQTPNVTHKNIQKVVPSDLYARVQQFFKKFQSICPDETMGIILILITLYSPELMGLEAREVVQSLQDRYIRILHQYVKFKFKERSSIMFPKAIVSLADIRELADRTWQMQISPGFHSRFSNMFSGSNLTRGETPKLFNPYVKIDNKPLEPMQLKPTKKNGLIPYQNGKEMADKEILEKVLDLMKSSCKGVQAPFFIPLVLQLEKKLLKQRQGNKDDKTFGSSKARRSHQYHQRAHRLGHKRRLIEIKKEKKFNPHYNYVNNCLSDPMAEEIVIKTELMETDSNDDYLMASTSNDSVSSSLSIPFSTNQEYLVHSSPSAEPSCHYPVDTPASRQHDGFSSGHLHCQNSSPTRDYEMHNGVSRVVMQPSIAQDHHQVDHQQSASLHQQSHHYSKAIYQQMDYQHLHPHQQPCNQDITELLPVDSSYVPSGNELPSATLPPTSSYPTQSSNADNYTMMQNDAISISPQNLSPGKNVPIQMINNSSPPQMSPVSPFSPPNNSLTPPISTPIQQSYISHHQQLSPGSAHSPYSSSSSSSSPEDYSCMPSSDFVSQDPSGMDIDMLTQLLDCLSNNENDEIPIAQILKELGLHH